MISQTAHIHTDTRSVLRRKGGKRIHLLPVMQLKGLFWVTGSNSRCSSVRFCWALPGAAGRLPRRHYFSFCLFILSNFCFYHSSQPLSASSVCVCALKEGDSGRFNGYKQGGLMDINRLCTNSLGRNHKRVLGVLKLPERDGVCSCNEKHLDAEWSLAFQKIIRNSCTSCVTAAATSQQTRMSTVFKHTPLRPHAYKIWMINNKGKAKEAATNLLNE